MSVPRRYICIHGHFYQPPRENPWLQTIETQESASPYHDWNERVTAECYEPNASARVLDAYGRIVSLRNNYSAISFNFGPTLLAWLQQAHPDLYAEVLRADAEGKDRYGCGNAIAQVYGHAILPLAAARDQVTQVRWGIEDFRFRYGRAPEGMWLPETAVDERSLAVLADEGIRFTILAPHQAKRVCYGSGAWQDTHGEGIDPSRPYLCDLGAGRSIILFFYDGPLSRGIAFEGWLRDGRALAAKLIARAATVQDNGLIHVASDGETYGHHHRFGEMALAAALDALEHDGRVTLTNYGAYLRHVEVRDRVEIRAWTSWSCAHGIERWRSGCPCHAGHPSWQHEWRGPLRESLDWLKAELDKLFEQEAGRYLVDPWEARNGYIRVLLEDTQERRETFLEQQSRRVLQPAERVQVWKLLEMERYALLMFTSCGWFFDDPSGLEATQVLAYAARAMQLASDFGRALVGPFLQRLRPMRSNLPQYRDGVDVFERLVRPRMSDHRRVVAHYAMNALFDPPPNVQKMYAYRFASQERVFDIAGTPAFTAGRVQVYEQTTAESCLLDYAAVHLGGHDFFCVVDRADPGRDAAWLQRLLETFRTQPIAWLLRELEAKFADGHFTLSDMFPAERKRILDRVTGDVLDRASRVYHRIVNDNRRLIEFLVHNELEVPEELRIAMRFVVRQNWDRRVREFAAGSAELDEVVAVADDARRWGVELDRETAAQVLGRALADAVACIWSGEGDRCYRRASAILEAGQRLRVTVETRWAQNLFFKLAQEKKTAGAGVSVAALRRLGEVLGFSATIWERRSGG